MYDDNLEFLEVVDDETGDTYFYEYDLIAGDNTYVYPGQNQEVVSFPLVLDWNSF
jgi:hypothetical protein